MCDSDFLESVRLDILHVERNCLSSHQSIIGLMFLRVKYRNKMPSVWHTWAMLKMKQSTVDLAVLQDTGIYRPKNDAKQDV